LFIFIKIKTAPRGARQAGIHAETLDMGPEGQLHPDKAPDVAKQAGERPKAMLLWLSW